MAGPPAQRPCVEGGRDALDGGGLPILREAVATGDVQAVAAQLAKSEGVNEQGREDGTTALYVAARDGRVEVVKLLLEAAADVNIASREGYSPLIAAAQNGCAEVLRLLLAAKADVNAATHEGNSALHYAAEDGHVEAARVLLEAAADANAATSDGTSPLLFAAQDGHVEVVRLLLAAKADVNTARSDGASALHLAAQNGHAEVVRALLLEAAADVNIAADCSPLFLAAQNGHVDVVRLLVEAQADVNMASDAGITPLHVAIRRGRAEAALLLHEHGAQLGPNVAPSQRCELLATLLDWTRGEAAGLRADLVDLKAKVAGLEATIPVWCAQAASAAAGQLRSS